MKNSTDARHLRRKHRLFLDDRGQDECVIGFVKEEIRKLVAAEDPCRPLSDQRIVEELKSINIDIARRTVTKYREALNILSSTRRREVR